MGIQEEKFLASAPKLRKKDVDAINDLFTAYVFRREKTGEIWTSCCRKHATLPPYHPIWGELHESAPRAWERPSQYRSGKETRTVCPFCGKKAQIKDLRYCGQMKNLWEEQHVVVLRAVNGVLWAQAAWVQKNYSRETLCEPPRARTASTYRFGKNDVTWVYVSWWTGAGALKKSSYKTLRVRTVDEPFGWTSQWGSGYWVIGGEELNKTSVKYCGFEEDLKHCQGLMKSLHVAFARPRQVEMLHKFGLDSVIYDLTGRGVKNCALFDWNEPDPRLSFDMTFDELRAAKTAGAGADDMVLYKILRKAGLRAEFEDLRELREYFRTETNRIVRKCAKYGVSPEKVNRYLHRLGEKNAPQMRQMWLDYVRMAENLRWNLKEQSVLLPKDLRSRHDEAAAEENERLHQIYLREHAEELAKQKEQLKKRHKKYDFEFGGYFIRLADDPQEILAEGKTLKHCVGGYAERHMSGKTSILFLRKADEPLRSLFTIEMDGAKLRQIHGYKNDMNGPQPSKTMAWMLEPWLAWVAAGSKRNKDGSPKIPQAAKTA